MSELTLLNLGQPTIKADYESNAPTGVSLSDIEGMEQFLIGLRSHTGQVVTPAKAIRASAVLACMRIISEDIAALRLPLYKRGKDGEIQEADNHPLYNLIDVAPNEIMTSMELREHMIYDLMLNGNFYNLKNTDENGNVTSLWPLQAVYVTRRWRELVWVFTDPVTGISGTFTPDLCWRGTMLATNAMDGQALTLLAREAIGLLLAAEEQGARLFKHGIQTDMTLSTDSELDEEDKKALRASFLARHGGSINAFMPMLLENGLKAARLGLTAQESQYIEARNFQIGEIARIFRVPEVLLGASTSGKSSTYASAEQFFNSYTKHTLTPWAVRIEQTMNRDLLNAFEKSRYFFKHDFSSLLRGDTAARYASYTSGIADGYVSPAEARRAEGMPFKPGLDYFNKPQAGGNGSADGSAAGTPPPATDKPTDESARGGGLPNRVASYILRKEKKAFANNGADAYERLGGFIEDMTGADLDSVMGYLDMRRSTEDKFSPESTAKAMDTLTLLCKKDG